MALYSGGSEQKGVDRAMHEHGRAGPGLSHCQHQLCEAYRRGYRAGKQRRSTAGDEAAHLRAYNDFLVEDRDRLARSRAMLLGELREAKAVLALARLTRE